MRASFIAIALVLFAASVASKDLSVGASRSLLQESPAPAPAQEDCSKLGLIDKAKCYASQAASTVSAGVGTATDAVVDTYNDVVGNNDKPANATAAVNGTTPSAPASSASAVSGVAAVAVATVFALAY